MARKRRPKQFSAVQAVKANARTRVGQPKASRVIPEKRDSRRNPRYKPTLAQTLSAPEDQR